MWLSNLKAFHETRGPAWTVLKSAQLRKAYSFAAVFYAKLLHRLSYAPGLGVERVLVSGIENLPGPQEQSPIIGFSHKKFHDVWTVSQVLLDAFAHHGKNYVAVGQAGIFSAAYPYADLIPQSWKGNKTSRAFSIFISKGIGGILRNMFSSLGVSPVFRKGSDIPDSEQAYQDLNFAGPQIFAESYEEYVKRANATTKKSFQTVIDRIEKGSIFLIAPEGKYCHDGSVAPLEDMMFLHVRKVNRPLSLLSLSYDELCPDGIGRIDAFARINPPLAAPKSIKEKDEFLKNAQDILQKNTVITASHLIARAFKKAVFEDSTSIVDWNRFRLEYLGLVKQAVNSAFVFDPGLKDEKYAERKLERFHRGHWLKWVPGIGFYPGHLANKKAVEFFNPSERTVSDLQWNINNARHFLKP